MHDFEQPGGHPIVLIGSHQESSSRSLESILVPGGYRVLKAYTGEQVQERARDLDPDVIFLDIILPDRGGLELCRELRRDPALANTPIVIVSPDHVTRQQRIDALRAGAWDHLGAPLDAEHLLLKVETFARSKLEAARAREEGLVDHATGLYNLRGLARRAHELASQASRQRAAFSCVVFAPDFHEQGGPVEPPEREVEAAVSQLAAAFKAACRQSDIIGRVGPTEFALVALGAGAAGSLKLAERFQQTLSSDPAARFRLRAGYYVVPEAQGRTADAAAIVLRAATAMRRARDDARGGWIQAFPDEPEDAVANP